MKAEQQNIRAIRKQARSLIRCAAKSRARCNLAASCSMLEELFSDRTRQKEDARRQTAAIRLQAFARGRKVRKGMLVLQEDGKLKRMPTRGVVQFNNSCLDEKHSDPSVVISKPGRQAEGHTSSSPATTAEELVMPSRVWSCQRHAADSHRKATFLPTPMRLPSLRRFASRSSKRVAGEGSDHTPPPPAAPAPSSIEVTLDAITATMSPSRAGAPSPALPLTTNDVGNRVLRRNRAHRCAALRCTPFRTRLAHVALGMSVISGIWILLGWWFAW